MGTNFDQFPNCQTSGRERKPAGLCCRYRRGSAGYLMPATAIDALDWSRVLEAAWIDLFNDKDLDGWVSKIGGAPAGQDS